MIELIHRYVLPAAYDVLPPKMNSREASAQLLAIGLKESDFKERKQLEGGPARGFWQFEKNGGVKGVVNHLNTRDHLASAMTVLRYGRIIGRVTDIHYAIEDNDVLAAVLARLLLWTLPARLPREDEELRAFVQYLEAWQPGAYTRGTDADKRDHRVKWGQCYAQAWQIVKGADHEPIPLSE